MELKRLTDLELEELLCEVEAAGYHRQISALSELQAFRKAVASPLIWTDEQELQALEQYKCAYLFKYEPNHPYHDPLRQILLFAVPKGIACR